MDISSGTQKARVSEAASGLLEEEKKCASEMCDKRLNKMCRAEENIKECCDQLLKKVQENPLAAVLIAGGVGFLLSKFLRK